MLTEGMLLTAVGMGFVFVFLTLLVCATMLMSAVCIRWNAAFGTHAAHTQSAVQHASSTHTQQKRAALAAAAHHHRLQQQP